MIPQVRGGIIQGNWSGEEESYERNIAGIGKSSPNEHSVI